MELITSLLIHAILFFLLIKGLTEGNILVLYCLQPNTATKRKAVKLCIFLQKWVNYYLWIPGLALFGLWFLVPSIAIDLFLIFLIFWCKKPPKKKKRKFKKPKKEIAFSWGNFVPSP
jgi:hypothetical protein